MYFVFGNNNNRQKENKFKNLCFLFVFIVITIWNNPKHQQQHNDHKQISLLSNFLPNILVDASSISSINQNGKFYASKFRYTRFGNVDNCGKRKRNLENRKCFRSCTSDADCRGSKRRCLCDGECGLSCVRITTSCTKIDEFKNGVVTYNPDNFFASQLIYECNSGYTLIGNKVRVCEGDGWWSGTSPTCTREVFCEYPPNVPNAIPNVQINNESKYKIGTEVEYQCDIGYVSIINDSNKIVCFESGKWSELKFKCTKINCGQPEEIENGIVKANDYSYSSVIEYKCIAGYRIKNGDYLRECGLDAKWSGRKPSCEPVDCGEPPFVKNAIVNYNQTIFESTATYSCISEKYYLDGLTQINCLANGRWLDQTPKCIEKNCTLNSTEYSKKAYNIFSTNQPIDQFVYSINTIIRISCHTGYRIVGQSQLICGVDEFSGKWTDALPICKLEIYCPLVNPPDKGLISVDHKPTKNGYLPNTTIEYSCLQGYKLVGSKVQVCDSDGFWVGDLPTCVVDLTTSTSTTTTTSKPTTTTTTTTPITTTPEIIETTTSLLKTLSILGSTPNRHHHHHHNSILEKSILKDNNENHFVQNCKIDSSSMLISYSNLISSTIQSPNEFIFLNATAGSFIEDGTIVSYYCKESQLVNYSAKCLNGTLVMQQNCNELITANKLCPQPPKVPNGYNKFGSFLHGSKAIYQCFTGYELSHGNRELKCVDGKWDGMVPVCTKINCGFPGIIPNGKIYYIGSMAEYTYQPYMTTVGQNKQIRYECDKDYKLVGPSGSTCINGNWKPNVKLVKCVKDLNVREPPPPIENQIVKLKSKYYAKSQTSNLDPPSLFKQNIQNDVINYYSSQNHNQNNINYKQLIDETYNNQQQLNRQQQQTKKSKINKKLKRLKKHKVKNTKASKITSSAAAAATSSQPLPKTRTTTKTTTGAIGNYLFDTDNSKDLSIDIKLKKFDEIDNSNDQYRIKSNDYYFKLENDDQRQQRLKDDYNLN